VRVFRFIVGVLVLGFGLSLSRSWLLAPSAASVPFVGLALAAVGAALVATSLGAGGGARLPGRLSLPRPWRPAP